MPLQGFFLNHSKYHSMYKQLLACLFFHFFIFPIKAQIIYCLDKKEIGTLTINNDNTCSLTPIAKLPIIEFENNSLPDITLYPDGKIYVLRGISKLYEVDVKAQELIYIDTIPESFFQTPTSLESDKGGRIYYAGHSRIGYYDLEKKQFFTIRNSDIHAAGDIAFIDNYILIAQIDKSIIELEKNTYSKVNEIDLSNLRNAFSGLAWANNKLYGSQYYSGTGSTESPDTSRIYEINLEEEKVTLKCQILGNPRATSATVIWGLTSEEHFRSNYEMYLDLDKDNSSGRFINHFEVDTFCTSIVPLTDRDVQLTANFPIDSITIEVETADLSSTEQILIDNNNVPNTIQLDITSATRIKLSAIENTTFADFEKALVQLKYDLQGNPSTKIERVIAFKMYGGGQVADIARAYLEVDLGRTAYAGADVDTTICPNRGFMALQVLQGEDPNGYWSPPFNNPNPNNYLAPLDGPGVFQYIAQTGECPADTAKITVTFHEVDSFGWSFKNSLVFLCHENDTAWVDISLSTDVIYTWDDVVSSPIHPITKEQEFNPFQIIDKNGCIQDGAYYSVFRDEFKDVTTEETLQFCTNETYEKNGIIYSQDTILYETFSRYLSGCDSTHITYLEFDHAPLTIIDTTICAGETFQLFDQQIDKSGIFKGITQREGQCDSLVDLYLTVLPPKKTVIDTILKPGATIQVGNFTLAEARTYFIQLTGQNGCDSLVQISIDFSTATTITPIDTYTADLFPIPALSQQVHLIINSSKADRINISIFDFSGRLMAQNEAEINSGRTQIPLSIPSINGIYWIELINESGQVRGLKGVRL